MGQQARRGPVASGRSGFSLSELVVAMAILGVVAAGAAEGLGEMVPAVRTERAVRGIGGLMEWARWSALREGVPFRVVLASSENQVRVYRVSSSGGTETQEQVRVLNIGAEYPGVILGAARSVPRTSGCSPVDPSGVHFLQASVRFLPSGTSDRCGSLYLIPRRDLPDRADRMRALSLILATGRVRLWAYDPLAPSPCTGGGAWRPLF